MQLANEPSPRRGGLDHQRIDGALPFQVVLTLMSRLACLCLLLSPSLLLAKAKPLGDRVADFCAKYDTVPAIEKRHREWTKQEPANPDAWILPANAILKAAESVTINAGNQKGAIAEVVDPKTGKAVGTIAGTTDHDLIQRGAAILADAAKRFPQRLDVHVGRMATSQRAGDVVGVRAAAMELLECTAKDPKAMRWIDGAAIEGDPVDKATREVHSRIRWLYGREKDESDAAAHDCAMKALELAPTDVELINDAAIYHLYRGEWKEGRDYLLRAEKEAPQDWIVQHNIARASAELGDKADALRRLEAIIQAVPGTNDARAAEKSIESLGLRKARSKK